MLLEIEIPKIEDCTNTNQVVTLRVIGHKQSGFGFSEWHLDPSAIGMDYALLPDRAFLMRRANGSFLLSVSVGHEDFDIPIQGDRIKVVADFPSPVSAV